MKQIPYSETARLKQSESIYQYRINTLENQIVELNEMIDTLKDALNQNQYEQGQLDIIDAEVIYHDTDSLKEALNNHYGKTNQ